MIDPVQITDDLFANNHAVIDLSERQRGALVDVYEQASVFFSLSDRDRYSSEGRLQGYRPFGMYFSDDGQRDQYESFFLRADRADLIPYHEGIQGWLSALSAWWKVLTPLAADVLAQIAGRYGREPCPFLDWSHIEINAYSRATDSEHLVTEHEDGHLLTLVTANRPGLEIGNPGEMYAPGLRPGQIILMAGSLLTAWTGGDIEPCWHRVRNLGLEGRFAAGIFISSPFEGDSKPFNPNAYNDGIDLAELSRGNCSQYGQPEQPRSLPAIAWHP
jgi:isopenicillin N synthase-like dioxygenase